jgi:hypothetical protein
MNTAILVDNFVAARSRLESRVFIELITRIIKTGHQE